MDQVALYPLDHHGFHLHIFIRPVVPAAWKLDDLRHHVLAFKDFAEDGVLAGEPFSGSHRDEELRAVGVWAGIGHRKSAGSIKLVRRALRFVLELISGAAHTGALRVATLNHEIGNHSVEDGAVVESV